MEEKINDKTIERRELNSFLKKSFNRWFLPHTSNSRRSKMTDINGYNDKDWPLEDDDEIS